MREHARASHVTVRIRALSGLLVVQVSDNGVGFALEQLRSGTGRDAVMVTGLGLRAMRARVRQAGGILEITSIPGKGGRR